MAYSTITLQIQDRIARITLNRPQSGNIINLSMAQELIDACTLIKQADDVHVVILTGNGKDFCLGNDSQQPLKKKKPSPTEVFPVAEAVAALEIPVICAVNGDALGQGLELALACDIRIAADTAKFGFTDISLGFIPTDGGTQRLPRLIGQAAALEMLFSGETIDAQRACEIGLISAVAAKEALLPRVDAMAKSMAQKAPVACRYIKEAVLQGLDLSLAQGLRLEADLYFLLHTTADRTEGIKAFQQKRHPEFKGK
ncbi:MAG: enoyl-CoA hydratase/isomerase family protein [Dehalococcoidales bacterium]|nr:enoyl-CoA hydratase/isomerase family protein [Dehalococcoidales bacterium]